MKEKRKERITEGRVFQVSEKDLKEEKDEAQEIEIEVDEPEKLKEDTDKETNAADSGNSDAEETGDEASEDDVRKEEGSEDSEEEGSEEGEDPEAKEKKKLFGKKKDKKDKKDEQIEALTDRVKRQMAEFENFRKRTEKEKSSMYEMGVKYVVEKILPVIDNFERGLAGADENDPFAEGMKMIYKQLMTMLTDLGVTPIDAEGKEFDPNLHNAVMHVDDDSFGDNIVAEELQKGYMFKDHVVRHSMVKVAN